MSSHESDPKTASKKSRLADILKFVIFLGIGLFFIYWFLLKLDVSQRRAIWNSFCNANYIWVALAMVCAILSHWVRALRWKLLYIPIGFRPRMRNTFGSVMIAYLANLAFPRLGEVVRCATMNTSEKIPLEKSLGTVFTERIIDVLAFGIVLLLGFFIMFGKAKDWLYDSLSQKFSSLPTMTTLAIVAVALVVMAFVFYKFCYHRLLKFHFFQKCDQLFRGCIDGLKSIFHLGARNTLMFIILSISIYLLYILGGLIILQSLPETSGLGFRTAFVIYLFGSVGMLISQGGLGAYPVLVWQALAIYGISQEVGLASGWLLWSSQQAVVIVVGLAFSIYFSLSKRRGGEPTVKEP